MIVWFVWTAIGTSFAGAPVDVVSALVPLLSGLVAGLVLAMLRAPWDLD